MCGLVGQVISRNGSWLKAWKSDRARFQVTTSTSTKAEGDPTEAAPSIIDHLTFARSRWSTLVEREDERLTCAGFETRDRHHPVRNRTNMAEAQVQLMNLAPVHFGYLDSLPARRGRATGQDEGARLLRFLWVPLQSLIAPSVSRQKVSATVYDWLEAHLLITEVWWCYRAKPRRLH